MFEIAPNQDTLPEYKSACAILEKAGCHFPLKYDTLSAGRCFGCEFCYRWQTLRARYGDREGIENNPRLALPISQIFDRVEAGSRDEISRFIRDRMPFKLGANGDPLAPDERVRDVTLETLEALVLHAYPFILVTRNAAVIDEDILELLVAARGHCQVQISVCNLDSDTERFMEPLAPSRFQRLHAIDVLLRSGVETVMRIAPIAMGLNDQDVMPLMYLHKTMGGSKVIIEQLRVEPRFKEVLENRHPDTLRHFEPKFRKNYLRYSQDTIRPRFQEYVEYGRKLGLQVGICSNLDLERELNDNKNCCLFEAPCQLEPMSKTVTKNPHWEPAVAPPRKDIVMSENQQSDPARNDSMEIVADGGKRDLPSPCIDPRDYGMTDELFNEHHIDCSVIQGVMRRDRCSRECPKYMVSPCPRASEHEGSEASGEEPRREPTALENKDTGQTSVILAASLDEADNSEAVDLEDNLAPYAADVAADEASSVEELAVGLTTEEEVPRQDSLGLEDTPDGVEHYEAPEEASGTSLPVEQTSMGDLRMLEIDQIDVDEDANPRATLEVESMVDSQQKVGILQPLVVQPVEKGRYKLLAGHRRLEAVRRRGETTVPVIVKHTETEDEARMIALESNIQFQNLSRAERARSLAEQKKIYDRLHPETIRGVAGGKVRPTMAKFAVVGPSTLSFADKSAILAGMKPRTVRNDISTWEFCTGDVQEAWLGDHITAQIATGLSKLEEEEQDALLPEVLDKKASELPDQIRARLGLRPLQAVGGTEDVDDNKNKDTHKDRDDDADSNPESDQDEAPDDRLDGGEDGAEGDRSDDPEEDSEEGLLDGTEDDPADDDQEDDLYPVEAAMELLIARIHEEDYNSRKRGEWCARKIARWSGCEVEEMDSFTCIVSDPPRRPRKLK